MYRLTTPKHIFIFPESMDSSNVEWANLTYSQCGAKIKQFFLNEMVNEDNCLSVHFTQEDTKLFEKGTAKVQLRIGYLGEALTTPEYEFCVYDVLNDEVFSVV